MSIFLKRPVRYLITRGDLTGSNFRTEKHHTLAVVRSAVKVGIELIQLREKNLEAGPLFELARAASAITSGSTTRLLVNERFDIALASGADGVHLTSRSLPIEAVRRSVPAGFIVGRSTHTRSEVLDARSACSDFALFGNVFPTPGKGDPAGLAVLENISASVSGFPVIAVGGIDSSNADSVIEAGAAGFASIRYLNEFVSIGE